MSVGRFALSAGAATLVSRVTGMARQIIVAAVFGAGVESDAFMVASRVPNVFRDLFAEGSMASAFIPNFAKTAEDEGLASAWALANALLGFLLIALGVVTATTIVFADAWVFAFAAGFRDTPGKAELAATLVQVMAPFLACVSLASLFGGMLNVRGSFFLPAVVPAIGNLAVIVGCLLPASAHAALGLDPLMTVTVATVLGGAAMFLAQYPALRRHGFRFRPTLRRHPALGRLVRFLGPALIGIGTIQVGIVVDQQLASGFSDGATSWLEYSFRLVQLPMNLFAGSVAVASLAVLSTEVARGHHERARATLADAVGLTVFLTAPTMVAMLGWAEPITRLFYERNAFDAAATAGTSWMLQCYALGTLAFCVHRVVVPSFYAFGDPWSPMVLSIGTILLKIPVALWWTSEGMFGVGGIPLAHAAVATAEVLAMAFLLGRRAGGYGAPFWKDLAKITVASLVMAAAGIGVRQALPGGLLLDLASLAVGGVVYFVVAGLLGLRQVREVVARLPLPGRGPRGLPPHIDEGTRAALSVVASGPSGAPVQDGDAWIIPIPSGTARLTAEDGVLVVVVTPHHDPSRSASIVGPPAALFAVLDTTRRPPPLYAVVLESGGTTYTLRAKGAAVVAAEAPGPRLVVPPSPV
jgi:putative peptidoglycan lipid II flippase